MQELEQPGPGVDHPPYLAPRLKKKSTAILILPSWQVTERTLPLPRLVLGGGGLIIKGTRTGTIVGIITVQLWMEVSGSSKHQHVSYRLHDVTSVLVTLEPHFIIHTVFNDADYIARVSSETIFGSRTLEGNLDAGNALLT
jgi:hypothetical protein